MEHNTNTNENKTIAENEFEVLLTVLTDYGNLIKNDAKENPEDKELSEIISEFNNAFGEFEKIVKAGTWKKCGPDPVQTIISIFEGISEKSRAVLLSATGVYSDILGSSFEEGTEPPEDLLKFYFQSVNLYNDIAAIFAELPEVNYQTMLTDIISDGIGLYPDYKAFMDSFQSQLAEYGTKNSDKLSYAVKFYEKMNKLEQCFFSETMLPEYIINSEKQIEESEENTDNSQIAVKSYCVIAAKKLYHEIMKKQYNK